MRQSRDVFILGSGFSRALSGEMPCVRDLAEPLSHYLELAGHDLPVESLLGARADVEALLGYLAEPQPWLGDAMLHRCKAALVDTVLWLGDKIWSCQSAAMEIDAPEDLLSLVRYWHARRSTVISFNYDTLVEAAFVSLREELGFPASGAGHLCLSTLNLPTLSARQGVAVLAGEEPETFRLLKLHGSLNWMYSGDRGGYGDPIYDTRHVGEWSTRSRVPFEAIRREAPGLEIALLPPTPTKQGLMGNGMLRELWLRAADAVVGADRIVLIGYSLPPSDRVVRSMLSVSSQPVFAAEEPKQVTPVDIDTTVSAMLEELLPHTDVRRDFSGTTDALNRFVGSLRT